MLLYAHTHAQQIKIKQDFGVWVGVVVKKKLPQNFQLSLEQQFRTCQNSSVVDAYLADLGLNYTINKNFRLHGNFRYIHDVQKWKPTENSLRYNFDLEFRTKFSKKFKLSYRLRYQQKFIDLFQPEQTIITRKKSTVRNKLKFTYKYKKTHQFYCSTELFVSTTPHQETHLDKLRFNIGNKIKTVIGQFNFAVGYEVNLQPQDALSFFFIKMIYSIEL